MKDAVYAKAFNEPVLQTTNKVLLRHRLLDQIRHVIRCEHYNI
jgi:hypothetical protein